MAAKDEDETHKVMEEKEKNKLYRANIKGEDHKYVNMKKTLEELKRNKASKAKKEEEIQADDKGEANIANKGEESKTIEKTVAKEGFSEEKETNDSK